MKTKFLSIVVFFLSLVTAGCAGLAGEPEIIGQVPRQSSSQNTALTIPSSQADLALGAQIFAANCVRCHGNSGAGDGEFVLSGQISEIPNFTDAAFHEGRSAAEYYTAVTLGRLEKLMPPFSGSLSDEERWSVANFVFTLAGASSEEVVLPATTEEPSNSDSTSAVNPEVTSEAHSTVTGTISGQVVNGTASGTIPLGSTVVLHVLDTTGSETLFETILGEEGRYQFADVPVSDSSGYRVTIEYGAGTFNSAFIVGTPANPDMTMDLVIYETTDDASVLQINVVLTQIDMLDENTIQIWQMINVTNLSDSLYISQNANGRSVSVRVPVPEGVTLSPDNDLNRFVYDGGNNYIYDTRPVVPLTEHSFHLIYTAPLNGTMSLSQSFDYQFFGPFEAYVDNSLLNIAADGWTDLGTQAVGARNYQGLGMVEGTATGQTLTYRIERQALPFTLDRNLIGYALMLLGLVFIVGSIWFYWRGKTVPEADTNPVSNDAMQSLMQQIAALDEKFEAKGIKKNAYEKERNRLKAELMALMKK